MNKQPLLITLEGGEGGGKTTQAAFLQQKLLAAGHEVLELREPGGTVISEQIRNVVLATKHSGKMHVATEVLLFQAARAQIYDELVLPALAANKIVIMDRSRDSSVVYQGIVRGFGRDKIEQLNNISTQETYPNLTILLDVPADIGLHRTIAIGEVNRFEMEDVVFHQQVRDAYLQLAREDTKRWKVVDASQPIEAVEDAVWQVVTAQLEMV